MGNQRDNRQSAQSQFQVMVDGEPHGDTFASREEAEKAASKFSVKGKNVTVQEKSAEQSMQATQGTVNRAPEDGATVKTESGKMGAPGMTPQAPAPATLNTAPTTGQPGSNDQPIPVGSISPAAKPGGPGATPPDNRVGPDGRVGIDQRNNQQK